MRDYALNRAAEAIRSDPRCGSFTLALRVKKLYRAIADEGPIEVIAITHPSTSTEFFVGWTAEGPHRLAVLRPGPSRTYRLDEIARSSASWTEEYGKYRDDDLNRRAYLFYEAGKLNPDLEAQFYGIWVAERAGLHAPGHDDRGETRSDGRAGLCRAMYATEVPAEVTDWLVNALASINAVETLRPRSIDDEELELGQWPARTQTADRADLLITIKPDADRVRASLDSARLYAIFPRDHRGRLKARMRVLLEPASNGSDGERRPWIVAVGPRRVGGGEVSIGIEKVIARNESERFDLAPWCWRKASGDLEDPYTWGYTSDFDKAIALVREGRIKEGLAASGLALDEAVSNLTAGADIGLLHPDPDWPRVAREQLGRLAPWLLLGPGLHYAKSVLKRKSDGLRLFTLPNQKAIRKASIMLVPGSRPALEVRWTGSNARLPLVLWQRPPIPGVWARSQA